MRALRSDAQLLEQIRLAQGEVAQLQPLAFVDDFLPYFDGVDARIHKALVLREQGGSPNAGPGLQAIDSTHATLADFSRWWLNHYQEEQT